MKHRKQAGMRSTASPKPGRAGSPRSAGSPSFSSVSPSWRQSTLNPPARHSTATAAQLSNFRFLVAQWAQRIRVKPRQVRLQAMRRKWASCSTAGTVSFSLDLLAQPAPFREYVIVHELLHLKVPNHGKLFKSLLRAYLPDHESIKPQPPPLSGPAQGKTL